MTSIRRATLALLVGFGVAVGLAGPAAAAELPTGAARVVAKVEQKIATRTIAIRTAIAPIQANAAARMGRP
jgi:hypothetical protein